MRGRRGRRTRRLLGGALGAVVAMAAGCGDDPVAPEFITPEFPALDAAIVAEFCIRGTMVPETTVSGEIADTDCPTVSPVGAGPGTYYEAWRLRVGSTGSVSLEIASGFDSFMDVFRIDDPTNPSLDDLVDFDDDGGTDANARLRLTLDAGVEYWVMVSGFDAAEVGPYALEARD